MSENLKNKEKNWKEVLRFNDEGEAQLFFKKTHEYRSVQGSGVSTAKSKLCPESIEDHKMETRLRTCTSNKCNSKAKCPFQRRWRKCKENDPVVVDTIQGVEHLNDQPDAVDKASRGIHTEVISLIDKALEQPLASKKPADILSYLNKLNLDSKLPSLRHPATSLLSFEN
jgi:hypothetical protein